MRIENATISLVPRTATSCLDLGVRYCGRYVREVGALWAIVALPSAAVVLALGYWREINVWLPVSLVFFATSPLGVLLGLGAVPSAFGEPFTFARVWHRLNRGGWRLLALGLAYRLGIALGLMLCVVPGVFLALRTGFFVELHTLQSMERRLHDRHTAELFKEEASELVFRGMAIIAFCGLLWLLMFITADVALDLLFGFPILLGRLLDGGLMLSGDAAVALMFEDPWVLALITLTALAVYPVGRMAWFFCYVDTRVRRDCWDMELQFSREARRLEGEGIAQ